VALAKKVLHVVSLLFCERKDFFNTHTHMRAHILNVKSLLYQKKTIKRSEIKEKFLHKISVLFYFIVSHIIRKLSKEQA